ncbi:MAG: GTP 3',8-cyclase MoaA [Planctomycetota bacterium]|nr:GTP 3',8-cyclase MoaA [Planctomycetota bacterium]
MNPAVLGGAEPENAPSQLPLVDSFGRAHRSLRLSVTDVCNIRCVYCMPEENPEFLRNENLLTFDALERFVRFMVSRGIDNLRLTGGEPLLRKGLPQLIARLAAIPGLDDIAMTTNAMLLAESAKQLADAGLRRINISLDTLSEEVFERISRRKGLNKVFAGIDSALAAERLAVKLNSLVLRDVNLGGVLELVAFAGERKIPLRFIEFMPLDAERAWSTQRMVGGAELRNIIAERFGTLEPITPEDPSRPSQDYRLATGSVVGFIDSVSKPFCGQCDRLRLTADGKLRNCLFGQQEWDVAPFLNEDSSAALSGLEKELHGCLQAKFAAHGIADPNFRQPDRPMYRIGG